MRAMTFWWQEDDDYRHLLFGCPDASDHDYDPVYYDGYCPVCMKDLCEP